MTTLGMPHAPAPLPQLDAVQQAAVDAMVSEQRHLVVVGVPGSGKTSVTIAAAAQAVAAGLDPAELLVLAPTRAAAGRLRDRVTVAVDKPAGAPMVRTASSLAFALLRDRAAHDDRPTPVLVTGAEQDVMLRQLLEGHAHGRVAPLDWGGAVPVEATLLPGFRAELRDLLMRAAEAGLVPDDLEALAARVGRPEWVAAAAIMREYESVTTLRSLPADQGARYDPASIVAEAAALVRDGGEATRPAWKLVLVDDAQDATAAVHDLLQALAAVGSRIVLVGNADEAVQGYRGAMPGALASATAGTGQFAFDARVHYLGGDKRQAPGLAAVTPALTQRVGTMGIGSPRTAPADAGVAVAEGVASGAGAAPQAGPAVVALTAPHSYGQSRAIAAQLRRARHGIDGDEIPWGRMCVIARSAALLRELRTDLAAADIPCEASSESLSLQAQPAVAPLLRILRVALGEPWTEEDAMAVLGSRLVGLDPVALRRLRRELLREERAGDGTRSSAELLVDALDDANTWAALRGPEPRAAAAVSRAVSAARERRAAPAPTPGAVLWAAWDALGVAQAWKAGALAGSTRDDADLDAVISLLRAAQNFTERLPQASVDEFIAYVEAQDFAADSLGARSAVGDAVAFATPASAAGREWDLVVVAGLEEGVWPNLRQRDSVLGAQHLAEILAGRAEATQLDAQGRVAYAATSRRQVLDDETRALVVAVSRARTRVVATAVVGEESRVSRFLNVIAHAAGVDVTDSAASNSGPQLADLRSAVVLLRSQGARTSPDRNSRDEGVTATSARAAAALAWLASRGVQGADPAQWHGVAQTSTDQGFWLEDERVRVSPSKVEWVEKCALRWALETAGATTAATDAQTTGTLLHALAERHPQGGTAAILADFDEAWMAEHDLSTWPARTEYQRARDTAHTMALYLESRSADEVLTEHRFSVPVGKADLVGSADRIELTHGGAYVVDIKTGRTAPSVAEAATNAQLAMYQLAVVEGAVEQTRVTSGAELAFVALNKAGASRVQGPIDADVERERLGRVVDTMAGSTFVAVVNDKCDGCPVRRACPAQPQGAQVTGS